MLERADEHGLEGLASGLALRVTAKQITSAIDNFDEFPDVRSDRRPVLREIFSGRFMYIQDIYLLFVLQDINVELMVPLRYTMGYLHLADRVTGRATCEAHKVQEDKEHRFKVVP